MEKKVVDLSAICEAFDVSDGYHTMSELYEHRIELWITVCRMYNEFVSPPGFMVWKSRKHFDGTGYPNWFILGLGLDKGAQITYHLPDKYWDRCNFALERRIAPPFDGHTSADVLERLKNL